MKKASFALLFSGAGIYNCIQTYLCTTQVSLSQVVPPAKLGTNKSSRCKKKKSECFFKNRKDIRSSASLINVMQLILSGGMKNRVERMEENVTGEHASLGKVCPL